MTVLDGKNEKNITLQELSDLAARYEKTVVDLGTGDGRNVYRKAKLNPDTLFIGIDPVRDNMLEISSKLKKKPAKGGLENVLLVIASAENMPCELESIAHCVTVLFPWGTLLEGIVKPTQQILGAVSFAAKDKADFEFITTYSDSCEEATIENRGLPPLSIEYFNGDYRNILKEKGFEIENVELHGNEYVKSFDSMWAKRLAFGRKRDFYRITGTINK
ncbi:MAG: class I SAM-dependent methyltransferase [Clostridia bacterium]|nr:class I SAM-dependent methyltransferase [Clostridia bacterium]